MRRAGWFPNTNLLLSITALLNFYPGIFSAVSIYGARWFFSNLLGLIFLTIVYFATVFTSRSTLLTGQNPTPAKRLLVALVIINLLNELAFKFEILPSILLFLAIWAISGLYLNYAFWKRSLFFFILAILTLPILERMQRFLGFPLRLFTAQVVSLILNALGASSYSSQAIIISENNATSIDLPCSGVKSLYTGSLFLAALLFLERVPLTLKVFFVSILFFALLIFANIWRVFSLVYINDILDLGQIGDQLHIVLGVVGFGLSCFVLWKLVKKYFPASEIGKGTKPASKTSFPDKLLFSTLILAFLLITFNNLTRPTQKFSRIMDRHIEITGITLTKIPFSDLEQAYFDTGEVQFSGKFKGQLENGQPFTLLLVQSQSARSHHDPETCLLAIGHVIENSQIEQWGGLRARKLTLNKGRDFAFYWFVGKRKNLLDYSERVWEEVTHPGESWTLVIVGAKNDQDLKSPLFSNLLLSLDAEAKRML